MLGSMPNDPSSSAATGADLLAAPLNWLERVARACQALGVILAFVTPVALCLVNLITSRYLAAFGQPGLSSLGDVATYLTSISPIVIFVVVLVVGFAALPILPRWVTSSSRHPFVDAFGWLGSDQPNWRVGLSRYAITHSAALTGALLAVVAFFFAKALDHGWWLWIAAGVVSLYWAFRQTVHEAPAARIGRNAEGLLIFVYANFVLFFWLATLASLALTLWRAELAALPPGVEELAGAGVILGLLCLHLLASASRWEAAVLIVGVVAALSFSLTDDRVLIGIALRYAKLGGGIPVAYSQPDVEPGRAPAVGCLVLAVRETQIVWVPEPKAAGSAPCDWVSFRGRLKVGIEDSEAGGLKVAARVRVTTRAALSKPN